MELREIVSAWASTALLAMACALAAPCHARTWEEAFAEASDMEECESTMARCDKQFDKIRDKYGRGYDMFDRCEKAHQQCKARVQAPEIERQRVAAIERRERAAESVKIEHAIRGVNADLVLVCDRTELAGKNFTPPPRTVQVHIWSNKGVCQFGLRSWCSITQGVISWNESGGGGWDIVINRLSGRAEVKDNYSNYALYACAKIDSPKF